MTNTDHLTAVLPTAASPETAPLPSPAPKYNMLAVIAIIVTSLNPILGIILGHIGFAQIRKTQERGKGLAITGFVLGYVYIAAVVLYIGFIFLMITLSIATPDLANIGDTSYDNGYDAGYYDGYYDGQNGV